MLRLLCSIVYYASYAAQCDRKIYSSLTDTVLVYQSDNSCDKRTIEPKAGESTAPPVTETAPANGAEGSQNEFKTWADEMCACKDPACLNKKIAGFKPLYKKYNGMTGEAARKVGEEAGKEAGRGVNCFIQGGGDKALMEEIAQMMR